jgi:hypothetical protein
MKLLDEDIGESRRKRDEKCLGENTWMSTEEGRESL